MTAAVVLLAPQFTVAALTAAALVAAEFLHPARREAFRVVGMAAAVFAGGVVYVTAQYLG